MKKYFIPLLVLFLFSVCLSAQQADLGSQLPNIENWVQNAPAIFDSVKKDNVLESPNMKSYFKWMDSGETELYYVYRESSDVPSLVFGDNICERAKIVFEGNDISSLTATAYSMNVNRFMLKKQFEKEVQRVKEMIAGNVKGITPKGHGVKSISRMKIKQIVWKGKELTYTITYAGYDASNKDGIFNGYFEDYCNWTLHKGEKKLKVRKPKRKGKDDDNEKTSEETKEEKEREKLKKKDMFIPGYVELKISRTPISKKEKKEQSSGKRGMAAAGQQKKGEQYVDCVKKDNTGDVLIEGIPMVDQGDSNFASCAIMERLVRYYFGEQNVNQYDLQLFASDIIEKDRQKEHKKKRKNSDNKDIPLYPMRPEAAKSAQSGMSNDMAKALAHKFGCSVNILYSLPPDDLSSLKRILKQYNVQAAKDGSYSVSIVKERYLPDGPKVVSISSTFKDMKCSVYMNMRKNETEQKEAFFKMVREQISLGYPVVWNVNLGIQPNPDGQRPSCFVLDKYCRLIVGYNDIKSLIYFSDTRGPKFEKVAISLDDAWPLTTGYMVIAPK